MLANRVARHPLLAPPSVCARRAMEPETVTEAAVARLRRVARHLLVARTAPVAGVCTEPVSGVVVTAVDRSDCEFRPTGYTWTDADPYFGGGADSCLPCAPGTELRQSRGIQQGKGMGAPLWLPHWLAKAT